MLPLVDRGALRVPVAETFALDEVARGLRALRRRRQARQDRAARAPWTPPSAVARLLRGDWPGRARRAPPSATSEPVGRPHEGERGGSRRAVAAAPACRSRCCVDGRRRGPRSVDARAGDWRACASTPARRPRRRRDRGLGPGRRLEPRRRPAPRPRTAATCSGGVDRAQRLAPQASRTRASSASVSFAPHSAHRSSADSSVCSSRSMRRTLLGRGARAAPRSGRRSGPSSPRRSAASAGTARVEQHLEADGRQQPGQPCRSRWPAGATQPSRVGREHRQEHDVGQAEARRPRARTTRAGRT